MTFLSLSAAWLAVLLLPLVAFYFLKLKRPRLVIPSLVLWRQVTNDQRVNSPFQRFKRNLLLLLQILLLALLVLAAMQPVLRREASPATRLPVLIDCSASMAALDKEGGVSRLDEAKRRIREMIDGLSADQQLCLIAFGKSARRLTGFTNNAVVLREALAALEVEDVPAQLDEALRLAQAIGRSEPIERVLLMSDGNFPPRANFELPFRVEFQRLPAGGPNSGITACNARRALGGQWQVFVQLGKSAGGDAPGGTVELLQDGAIVGRENVTFAGQEMPRLLFSIGPDKPAQIQLRFQPNGFDSLASDNVAWLSLPQPRPIDVHVAPTLHAFRHALSALSGVRVFPGEGGEKLASYDLVITDSAPDLALPAAVQVTVGLIPPELAKLVVAEKESSGAIDWRRDSPLLQHVSFEDVIFLEAPRFAPGVGDADLAAVGGEVIAHSAAGPLIIERGDREVQRVNFLFHPDRSTLPFRVGFPVLVSNLVQAAQARSKLAEATAVTTGVLPAMKVQPLSTYRIEGPAPREERSDEQGQLGGIPAPRAGEYTISGPGTVPSRIGASLLSPQETSLAAIEQIEFNDQITVKAAAGAVPKTDRALWWLLACGGFGVLLVEWWLFHRPALLRAAR